MRVIAAGALVFGAAIAVLAAVACVDVEGGDRAIYTSPCGLGGFSDLLLCDRGTGGADPSGGGSTGDEPFSCADACQRLFECGVLDSSDISECTIECEVELTPQSVLDCIERNGCSLQICVN